MASSVATSPSDRTTRLVLITSLSAVLVPADKSSSYCALAGDNISSRFVVPTVAASVDLVVHVGIDADGARTVQEIVGVPGRVENEVIETEALFVRRDNRLCRAQGMPPRRENFERAGLDLTELLRTGD